MGRLRQEILTGRLKPGDTIPSYRTLMGTHEATANTVRHAIMTLQTAGLIQSAPGIGCVVAKRETKRHTVGLAVIGQSEPDPMAQFMTSQLMLVHDQLDKLGCDLSCRFVPILNDESLAALTSWAKRWDGVLLSGVVPAQVAQAVANSGAPLVLLGEPSDQDCPAGISNVTTDVRNLIHLAVSHLFSLGHRRIVLCSFRSTRYFDLVAQSFRSSMTEYGVGAEALEWYFDRDDVESCSKFLPWLSSLPNRPTAMLVEQDTRATTLVGLLEANGCPVPVRMSVLAISSAARQAKSMEGLTCVLSSVREIILRAVDILLEDIRSVGRTVRVEKIPSTFVPGHTCRSLEGKG